MQCSMGDLSSLVRVDVGARIDVACRKTNTEAASWIAHISRWSKSLESKNILLDLSGGSGTVELSIVLVLSSERFYEVRCP
jgi:hypothetical protein